MRTELRHGAFHVGVWIISGAFPITAGCHGSHEHDDSDPTVDALGPHLLAAQPTFGAGVTLSSPPPPISGGTLTIAPDGVTAFAADPDRDRVYVVDLAARVVSRTYELMAHDEPGRIAVDTKGRAHVALRSAGALLTIDPKTGTTKRRAVCTAPRGVAYDATDDSVLVACVDGTLARFPAEAGEATMRVTLDRDLRDVTVRADGSLFVSTFRRAQILHVGGNGALLGKNGGHDASSPNVMWRMIPLDLGDGNDGVLAAAQRPRPDKISLVSGGYGADPKKKECPVGIVAGQLVSGWVGATRALQLVPQATLPVDVATDGVVAVIVSAGNGHTPGAPQLFIQRLTGVQSESDVLSSPTCAVQSTGTTPGQPTAAAFDRAGDLIVQSREPAALYIMSPDKTRVWRTITLANDSREDTGHAIFHSNSGAGVACACCHAEGGEDGHTWQFEGLGPRRTPSLRGTAAHTEPFHWDGSQKDMSDIVTHVFEERMSGPTLPPEHVSALTHFVYALPAPPPIHGMDDSAQRGKGLFESHGCSGCHGGPMLTNNQTVDVGTGAAFQVQSLKGVGWRAPFLHDGCASTLIQRFGPCGGDKHGTTGDLGPEGVSDLTAFLETL